MALNSRAIRDRSANQDMDRNTIAKIKGNYVQMEELIVNQLVMSCQHHPTTGGFREEVWKSLFEQIVPRKFSIERSVFIIDSSGRVSNEVDLAIFDEQYTPYIFRYGMMKYIPIEAVAVVVQCKSEVLQEEDLEDWTDSIDRLRTSLKSVARLAGKIVGGEYDYKKDERGRLTGDSKITQTSTRPLKILCHTNRQFSPKRGISRLFDIIIHPDSKRLKIYFPLRSGEQAEKSNGLAAWYEELNHVPDKDEKYKDIKVDFGNSEWKETKLEAYKVYEDDGKKHEISLLSLTFQLNQLLMLINNPMLFPHIAYVEMFNVASTIMNLSKEES